MNETNENKKLLDKTRPYIRLGTIGLTELFTEALCTSVLGQVGGGKFAKFGARIGAGLIGLMVGGQVGDYICDGLDRFSTDLDDFKDAIDKTKEGN